LAQSANSLIQEVQRYQGNMRFSADKSGIKFRYYTSKSVSYMHPPIASRDIFSVAISQLCWINDDVVLYACGLGNFRELDEFLLRCAKKMIEATSNDFNIHQKTQRAVYCLYGSSYTDPANFKQALRSGCI
jgi:hypothetical protein